MNFKNNLLSFIYDKNYCICLYNNNLYIYNYKQLIDFNSNSFNILIDDKHVYIDGNNLKVSKLTDYELEIKGDILNVKIEDINENKSSN